MSWISSFSKMTEPGVVAAGFDGGLDELGVGRRKIRRRQRIDVLAGHVLHARLGPTIGNRHGIGNLVQVIRVEQISLADVVEHGARRPFGSIETTVARLGLDRRLSGFARPRLRHGRPQTGVGFGELPLELRQLLGFGQRQLWSLGRRNLRNGDALFAEEIEKTFSQRLAELEHALQRFGRLLRCYRHPALLYIFIRVCGNR